MTYSDGHPSSAPVDKEQNDVRLTAAKNPSRPRGHTKEPPEDYKGGRREESRCGARRPLGEVQCGARRSLGEVRRQNERRRGNLGRGSRIGHDSGSRRDDASPDVQVYGYPPARNGHGGYHSNVYMAPYDDASSGGYHSNGIDSDEYEFAGCNDDEGRFY
ncbi:hypothetical protein THAOC_36442 [Thalassiosira oceanica]|uniref:Uncharacterized protein n=1 Tax=Thalassiosira oceanica TaxID=159749 RepID=K0R859_THAOC|nr:hypothetical protein THAOC_36442 [Thalassiosira oceanica]|eukprot:EJK44976.1 hypothetical protein THAOC_36442 [Thalassiosira oceanica]